MEEDKEGLNEEEIQKLINNEVEESLHLEYKACKALKKEEGCKKELSKDVSSFANSDSGTIIYGVIERNNKPITIDVGFDPNDISKEWIEQVINSRISPKIEDIIITPIPLSNSDKFLYLIKIPKSDKAPHQASDKKYYKRYNFQSVPMEEYEIRELYFRNIISQTEFRKLQAQVREKIYKPLLSKMIILKSRFLIEEHPNIIYFIDDPLETYVRDDSLLFHDFRFWNEIKGSGDFLDIYGIGDSDLIDFLDNIGKKIIKYNSLTRKNYEKFDRFLGINIEGTDRKPLSDSRGWLLIKEEIFSKTPNFKKQINTIWYLRKSTHEKWIGLRKLQDDELFNKLYDEIMSKFSDEIIEINKLAKQIRKHVNELIDLIKIKIINTYPKY